MWMVAGLMSALIALWVTASVGHHVMREIASDDFGNQLPPWLESVAPVKGRWLRCLLAAPAVAVFLAFTFLAITFLGWLIAYLAMSVLQIMLVWFE